MKRATVQLRDECHKLVKLFCADYGINQQEFYIKAQAMYLQKYCNSDNIPLCSICNSINPDPTAPFDYTYS